MENNELSRKWPMLKSKLMEQYPELTQEELMCEIGKEAELLKQLQQKLVKNKKDIDNWLSIMG